MIPELFSAGVSRIILQNFTHYAKTSGVSSPTYPVSLHREEIWKHINGVWGPRVEACVEYVRKHPRVSVLVEGAFAYGRNQVLYVLAVVMFDKSRPLADTDRYTILNSVTRLG